MKKNIYKRNLDPKRWGKFFLALFIIGSIASLTILVDHNSYKKNFKEYRQYAIQQCNSYQLSYVAHYTDDLNLFTVVCYDERNGVFREYILFYHRIYG